MEKAVSHHIWALFQVTKRATDQLLYFRTSRSILKYMPGLNGAGSLEVCFPNSIVVLAKNSGYNIVK